MSSQLKRLATMLANLSEADRATVLAPYAAGNGTLPPRARDKRPCACGCGGATASRFCPGHDARLKGQLLAAHRSDAGLTAEQRDLVAALGWDRLIIGA